MGIKHFDNRIIFVESTEDPQWGDSKKQPLGMLLRVSNTIFKNISIYMIHLVQRICFVQIIIITSFVVLSNIRIKMVDCTSIPQSYTPE